MTRRDDSVPMRHMLDFAREIRVAVSSYERNELFDDRYRELALMKLFEMLGEAANRVSQDVRDEHPEIPWRRVIGMRNRLIHGYDLVNLDIIWDTAQEYLPELIEQLEDALRQRGIEH